VESGDVLTEFALSDDFFAEGCTYYYHPPDEDSKGKVRIVQLTWKAGRGFVYDLFLPTDDDPEWSFLPIGDFEFNANEHTTKGEGWGIIYHPLRDHFIVSDGTRNLYAWKLTERISYTFINDNDYITTFDFEMVEKIKVTQKRNDLNWETVDWNFLNQLNELEWDPYSYGGGTILANIWKSNEIVRIWVGSSGIDNNDNNVFDDASMTNIGKVSHVYDLSDLKGLANPAGRGAVLNGIAFDWSNEGASNEYWVTGKLWPSMFRIRLTDE